MPRVLVTGATGFIGRRLVAQLARRGDEITCLVRASSDRAPLEPYGVKFAVGDMTDPTTLADPIGEAEVIYHLAGQLSRGGSEGDFEAVNRRGVEHLMTAAARPSPPTLVLVSSLAAGGPSRDKTPVTEDDEPAPVSAYGRSKLAGERAAQRLAHKVPTTVVRPPMVFGPGDQAMLPLFKMAASGLALAPGRNRRYALIHVDDLALGIIAAADRGERLPGPTPSVRFSRPGRGIYYISYEETPTFTELVTRMAQVVGRKPPRIIKAPDVLTWAAGGVGEGMARLMGKGTLFNLDKAREATAGSWICTSRKAAKQLKWQPTMILDEALRDAVEWYDG